LGEGVPGSGGGGVTGAGGVPEEREETSRAGARKDLRPAKGFKRVFLF